MTEEFYESLNEETERGLAIVSTSYLDAALEALLRASFFGSAASKEKLLDSGNGPIGTFSAKIKTAFALGLIGERARNDLDIIRDIRNDFAHSYGRLRFDDPTVRDRCQSLKTRLPMKNQATATPRAVFTLAVMVIAGHLTLKTIKAKPFKEGKDLPIAKDLEFDV